MHLNKCLSNVLILVFKSDGCNTNVVLNILAIGTDIFSVW